MFFLGAKIMKINQTVATSTKKILLYIEYNIYKEMNCCIFAGLTPIGPGLFRRGTRLLAVAMAICDRKVLKNAKNWLSLRKNIYLWCEMSPVDVGRYALIDTKNHLNT